MAASSSVKLRAHDPLDMEVIATWLQDALVPLADGRIMGHHHEGCPVLSQFVDQCKYLCR